MALYSRLNSNNLGQAFLLAAELHSEESSITQSTVILQRMKGRDNRSRFYYLLYRRCKYTFLGVIVNSWWFQHACEFSYVTENDLKRVNGMLLSPQYWIRASKLMWTLEVSTKDQDCCWYIPMVQGKNICTNIQSDGEKYCTENDRVPYHVFYHAHTQRLKRIRNSAVIGDDSLCHKSSRSKVGRRILPRLISVWC